MRTVFSLSLVVVLLATACYTRPVKEDPDKPDIAVIQRDGASRFDAPRDSAPAGDIPRDSSRSDAHRDLAVLDLHGQEQRPDVPLLVDLPAGDLPLDQSAPADQSQPVDLPLPDAPVPDLFQPDAPVPDLFQPDMPVPDMTPPDTFSPDVMPNLTVTVAPVLPILGWSDSSGNMTQTTITSPSPTSGLTYECRTVPKALLGGLQVDEHFGPCDGLNGDTSVALLMPALRDPLCLPSAKGCNPCWSQCTTRCCTSSTAPYSGVYVTEMRARFGGVVGSSTSLTYYAHESLKDAPLCPSKATDVEYFAAATVVLDISETFGAATSVSSLDYTPFHTVEFLPPAASARTVTITTLRRVLAVNGSNTLMLIKRRYGSRTHGNSCASGVNLRVIWPIPTNPSNERFLTRHFQCDAVVVNAKGTGVCLEVDSNSNITLNNPSPTFSYLPNYPGPNLIYKLYKYFYDPNRNPFSDKSSNHYRYHNQSAWTLYVPPLPD